MSENTQNKLHTNDLQLLLRRKDRTLVMQDVALLTITDAFLKRNGLEDYYIEGIGFGSDNFIEYESLFNYSNMRTIQTKINNILQASIVNQEQRKAVGSLIEEVLHTCYDSLNRYLTKCVSQVHDDANLASNENGILVKKKEI